MSRQSDIEDLLSKFEENWTSDSISQFNISDSKIHSWKTEDLEFLVSELIGIDFELRLKNSGKIGEFIELLSFIQFYRNDFSDYVDTRKLTLLLLSEAIRDAKYSERKYNFRPYLNEFRDELNEIQKSIDDEYQNEFEPPRSSFETHSSQINAKWSRYKLKRLIGTGSHAKVYFAIDLETGENVAVKFMRKQFHHHAARIEAFINEAKTLKKFHHENVINIRGLGQVPNGGYFIVLDWIPGRSLHEQLETQEFISESQIRQWAQQICQGLQHIHNQGIIHCDLKPANILLNEDNRILITDFGFAKYLKDEVRQASGIQGTVNFMAPEQIDPQRGQISPATDIYAVGVILYLFLTKRLPFIGKTFEEIALEKLSSEFIADPRKFNCNISESIASICMKCLHMKPSLRFSTVDELYKAIILYNQDDMKIKTE